MLTQEQFNKIELQYGCGYWNICWEHACPCAITTENKGLQESIYNSLVQECNEISEDYQNDTDWDWDYFYDECSDDVLYDDEE